MSKKNKNLSQRALSEKIKWLSIEFLKLVCLLFTVFAILLFLVCLFSTFVIFLGIFSIKTNWDVGIQLTDKLYLLGNVTECDIANLVNVLGVCLSGVLVPVITLFISVFITIKTNEKNVGELLAKSKDIKFYFISLPFGSWHNLSVKYQREVIEKYKTNKPLSRQDCCLHLFFEGEVFQTCNIEIRKVGISLARSDNDKILFGSAQQHGYYFTSDITGVERQENNRGTNISLIFGQDAIFEEEKISAIIKEKLLNTFQSGKNIYFDIKFNQLGIPFFHNFVNFYEKDICYRITLWLNNFEPTDDRNVQYKCDIYDIDIETVRCKSWKPEDCKYRVKTTMNGESKESKLKYSKETAIKKAKRQAEKLHLSEFKILHSDGTESTVILKNE